MTDEVKAKVAEHHFKENVNVGETRLTKRKPETVKVNTTLRNMVRAGNIIVTEGSISPERDEKEFQGNDGSGENSEKGLGEMSYNELRKKASKYDEIDARQNKEELLNDLKEVVDNE